MYARPIEQLIKAFKKLPGVGQRTAERFVFKLLKSGKKDVAELQLSLKQLIDTVKSCETCWDFSDRSPCAICNDSNRDHTTICVVETPQNVQVLEQTNTYKGAYHILRGTIDPDAPAHAGLKISELLHRVASEQISEVILAFNPDLAGETTMMLLSKRLKETAPSLRVTRLARGLPMGSDLLYADEMTLGSALKHRTDG